MKYVFVEVLWIGLLISSRRYRLPNRSKIRFRSCGSLERDGV